MAESSDYTALVFDYQVEACEAFFKLLSNEFDIIIDRPDNMKHFNGPIYDITGFDAQQVVAVLSDIVNNKLGPSYPWLKNKTFYLRIRRPDYEELFRLQAKPTKDQPGNAIVFLRPRGKIRFTQEPKKYEELNGALKAHYESDTTSFAQDIQQLFKNNAQNDHLPQATFEAYMILLFEIARRLVTTENPSERKEEFDVLPIGSAIAGIVKLLELKTCLFEDVFLPGGRFHCFTGKPEARRKAIDNINMAISLHMGPYMYRFKNQHLKELQELFFSEQRLTAMRFEGLKMKTSDDSESSWAPSVYNSI